MSIHNILTMISEGTLIYTREMISVVLRWLLQTVIKDENQSCQYAHVKQNMYSQKLLHRTSQVLKDLLYLYKHIKYFQITLLRMIIKFHLL